MKKFKIGQIVVVIKSPYHSSCPIGHVGKVIRVFGNLYHVSYRSKINPYWSFYEHELLSFSKMSKLEKIVYGVKFEKK